MKGSFKNDQNIQQHIDASINLNSDKSEIIIKQNKITKTIKNFIGQTFISQFIVLHPSKTQLMNIDVYQDLMSYTANFVNQQDVNLIIFQQNGNQLNQNRLPNYILKHSIVIESNQKKQEQILESIGDILINIGEKIEKIIINAYQNGDHNLDSELQAVINQYQQVIQNIE
ncbi:unnamed protein product [Paramecium pentaurelia]|uniref:Uncharacterized protein n=1 Tax=Paramecium pentaurelia TaxID=43138 RepID=A0A8S1SG74_9CILI|nr:unnamed protein product [Paramecium pentaurelia]